jgi:hypothetical protein
MGLTHDRGDIIFQCDACHDTLETNTSNFASARNVLTRNGWRPYKKRVRRGNQVVIAEEWSHSCPDCQD